MQSNIQKWLGSERRRWIEAFIGNLSQAINSSRIPLPWGPVTRQRLLRSVLLYGMVYLIAVVCAQYFGNDYVAAFSTGLILPGSRFLYWANPAGPGQWWFLGLYAMSVGVFGIAMVLWFATGNIIAPVLVWAGSALAAATLVDHLPTAAVATAWPVVLQAIQLLTPLAIVLAFVAKAERSEKDAATLQRYLDNDATEWRDGAVPEASTSGGLQPLVSKRDAELSHAELQQMRGLLDRSLQPVDAFDGFDQLDQFQTAALRYQINFVSYALSAATQVHLPAAQGYMLEAQRRLALKLLNPRVWGYWQLENLWGNLRSSADPIPRDNIMLSGFLAAQFGLARGGVSMQDFDGDNGLVFRTRSGQTFRYSLQEVCEILKQQYQSAPFGLLACEPNWVFPLCNSITALGMRSLDTQFGTSQWEQIAERFRHSLNTEFTSANGLLVPIRSSRTGIAAPMIGGGAMQTFPCLFLNALLPDVAARQYQLARENLTQAKGRRALWPVDIGNYRFNRAASCGACAAVAVEMGDNDTATRLLQFLEEDHPLTIDAGVAHRPGVSLWAHALEFTARAGTHNAIRHAANKFSTGGPVIRDADYPQVLLARAHSNDGCLHAVLYPCGESGVQPITLAGLRPEKRYRINSGSEELVTDSRGESTLQVNLCGRTEVLVTPIS